MGDYPKILHKCPLVEANFEIRFTSTLPEDAVFGVVYQALNSIIKGVLPQPLPIINFPIEVRRADPNLSHQPHYQIRIENWTIAIGPRIIMFSNRRPYNGWQKYKGFVIQALDLVLASKTIKQINRVGLRYVNVIYRPLFDNTKIQIHIVNDILKNEETTIHTTMQAADGFQIGLHLNNNVNISINNQPPLRSSLIDIDVFHTQVLNATSFRDSIESILENSHAIEKQKFFSLLSPELLKLLEPEY